MSQEVPVQPPGPPPQREESQETSWSQKLKDKCLRSLTLVYFSAGVRITLLISLIFYIAMFGVGIWGVNKCPIEDNIPFFLIVTGGIGLLSKFVSIIREAVLGHYPVQHVESSLYTVELVFLLLGSYWVFKVYKPSYIPTSHDYCNKTVYMFAFVYLAVLYSILFIMGVSFCCFLACFYFVSRTRDNVDIEAPTTPLRNDDP